MVIGFISAAKRRISYMIVFYGISPDSIKNLMFNCHKLINKLKKEQNKNTEEESLEESEEEKNTLHKKIQNENISRNSNIINNHENEGKVVISLAGKLFFIFYILFMSVMYTYFPYNGYYLFNLSNTTMIYANFILKLNRFHSSFIEIFNAYREYLFDNKTTIEGIIPYEYLIKKEKEAYERMNDDINSLTNFIYANIEVDNELTLFFNKELCSFILTDYFSSSQDCQKKFGDILNYDFTIIITNFIQNIRNTKNIVKYKHQTELFYGELAMYEVGIWETWNNTYFGEETEEQNNKNKSFKLALFNDKIVHSDFNLIFLNIFIPYSNANRKEIISRANIDREGKQFSIVFFIFITLLLLMYLAYLLPMIKYLNNYIYKTKNMLLLIPMSILSSQDNIKSLLNLS